MAAPLKVAIDSFQNAAMENTGILKMASYFYAARCSEWLSLYEDRECNIGECNFYDRQAFGVLQEIKKGIELQAQRNAKNLGVSSGSLSGILTATITASLMVGLGNPLAMVIAVPQLAALVGFMTGGSMAEWSKNSARKNKLVILPLNCTDQELGEHYPVPYAASTSSSDNPLTRPLPYPHSSSRVGVVTTNTFDCTNSASTAQQPSRAR